MPDMSDYIRNKRIKVKYFANVAADDRKFRAPTADVSTYDAHLSTGKGCKGIGNDVCNPTVKHNTFAAKVLSANPAHTTG